MDWLAFLEKKQTELANTGHKMDDEMFITHLLNSLPQSEYKGAILVIKDKLINGDVELPEIEQILEDNVRELDLAMCVSPSSNGSKMRSLWTNQMKS